METRYRFYVLVHSHLSTIQKGIQAAHVVAEMIFDCDGCFSDVYRPLWEWISEDKTLIILDGGNTKDLEDFEEFLLSNNHPYLYTTFREDKETLNELLTAVGILVPENAVDPNAFAANWFDRQLYELLTTKQLAK